MIRMLGVLCGAAIATGLLTWLVGVPQFTSERAPAEEPLAVVTLPTAGTESALVAAAEEPTGPAVSAPVEDEEPPADSQTVSTPEPVDEPREAQVEHAPQWFAFWTPFRSEIAANGFVSRLQSVTGLDYRVVKVDAGEYEVAFAYDTEAEIESNIATITAATGLELAGLR